MIRGYLHGKRIRILKQQIDGLADLDIGAGKEHKGKLTLDILPRLRPEIVADILHLPFRAGAMQSVVCSHVVEHVSTPDQALEEIKRILGDNGLAFFFLPDDSSIVWRLLSPIWTTYYSRFVIREASPHTHLSSFDYESFEALIKRHFSVVGMGKLNAGAEMYAICRK
jgi:ubiquinone/menaquinone biosynthesis C-methylase UbiE